MKKNKEQVYLEKWIEKKIPRSLWENFQQAIGGMSEGFYEGIKFERQRNHLKNPKRRVN